MSAQRPRRNKHVPKHLLRAASSATVVLWVVVVTFVRLVVDNGSSAIAVRLGLRLRVRNLLIFSYEDRMSTLAAIIRVVTVRRVWETKGLTSTAKRPVTNVYILDGRTTLLISLAPPMVGFAADAQRENR